jgi:methionyl-tRNA formyltransferase
MSAKTRIALLTSNDRRHRWVAARLAEAADLVCVVAESKPSQNSGANVAEDTEIQDYFAARRSVEGRWFHASPPDFHGIASNVRELAWQGANSPEVFEHVSKVNPDRIFLFGSSIIREPLLSHFSGRIINMHLGLSPYYRGSATNFWPLVDGLPECVGVTIHHATAIVDGGGILAQARPDLDAGDDVHDVGCKAIMAGAALLQRYARWPDQQLPEGVRQTGHGKLCRRADFSIDALHRVQSLLRRGMLEEYLAQRQTRDAKFPIIHPQPELP